jgi:hypothetical protein
MGDTGTGKTRQTHLQRRPAGNSCADKGKNNGRIEQERKQNSKAVETIFCSCEDFPMRFYMHYEMFLLMAAVGIRK